MFNIWNLVRPNGDVARGSALLAMRMICSTRAGTAACPLQWQI
jgi:hypothetical protein